MLSIDTEGLDPLVLDGAQALLRRTKLLAFEYNGMGAWLSRPLEAEVARLGAQGFDCYFMQRSTLLRLTPASCFVAATHEHRSWSNVLCAHRALAPGPAAAAAALVPAFPSQQG